MTAIRICFVGDSLTAGTYDDEFLGWPGRLCRGERSRGHEVTAYNLGIRADTSTLIAARWRTECEPRLPGDFDCRLVFSFGVNDSAALEDGSVRVSLEASIETARGILSQASEWLPSLWIGPVPTPDRRQPFRLTPALAYSFESARCARYNDAYAALASDVGVPYLDLFTALSSDDRWARLQDEEGDGVHPPAAGYAQMAEHIARWEAWRAWWDG